MVKGPAPDAQVEHLHENKADGDVDGHGLDGNVLLETHPACPVREGRPRISESEMYSRQTAVHDQKTGLHQPNRGDLHLFHYQDHFGAVYPLLDVLGGEFGCVVRVYQVAGFGGDNVHSDDEDGVGQLRDSVSFRSARGRDGWPS